MKIIVIGKGKVGAKLSEQLVKEGYDVVVIDRNSDALESANNSDIICIEGNGAEYGVQMEAGISEADLVIACTSSDEINMLCCLLAKKHGAKRTIARVRNPEYYEQLPHIQEELGLSMAINPERAAAAVISRVLLFPVANNVEPLAKGRVELIEFHVEGGNPLIGKALSEINRAYGFRLLICAIQRDNHIFIPTGVDILQTGDRIHMVASHKEIQKFFEQIDLFRSSVKRVMIAGGGRISYYLAKTLLQQKIQVKIIEQNMERCRSLCETLPKAVIIHGDATNEDLLGEEGIENMDAFVAVTGLDEVNIILSIYARSKKVSKIITKVTQISFTDMLDGMGIESIISPKAVTANIILRYVRSLAASANSNSVESLIRLLDGNVEALEFHVKKKVSFLNIPLKDLSVKKGFLVACIVRKNEVIIPGGNDSIQMDDSVIVVTTHPHVQDLQDMVR